MKVILSPNAIRNARARMGRACFAAALFACAAASSKARAQEPAELGSVRASEFSPNQIAIPPFDNSGSELLTGPQIADVLMKDLILSGFFREPANPQFVRETQEFDKKDGTIHYADWYKMGVSYVVKGTYKIVGSKIESEVRAYDTTAGKYIFGKLYQDYLKTEPRKLAHYISNDIIQKITGVPGASHTKLVFVGETTPNKGQMSKEIFIMDADGENRRQLTNDNNLAATPSWGARGTEIYFTTYKDYNPDLMGLILDSKYSWFVSRRNGFNISPDWSEKNLMIALTLSRDGNSEIYTITREGKDPKRLTFNKSIDSSPAWSPDGSKIAFTSDRGGSPQLYIMDASGVNVRQLTRSGSYNDGAMWSPKGDMIAYSSRIDGTFQLFVIAPDGTNNRQLTNNGWNSEDPSWSPSGWVIAYTSEKTGTKQIHTMFVDGRPSGQLTKGRASYSSDWSPMFP